MESLSRLGGRVVRNTSDTLGWSSALVWSVRKEGIDLLRLFPEDASLEDWT